MVMDNFVNAVDERRTLAKRVEFLPRWAEICGVADPRDIDYTNTQVHLEYILCDVKILRGLSKPGGRDALFSLLTDEERDMYLYAVDDGGHGYTVLESREYSKALAKELKETEREIRKAERKKRKLAQMESEKESLEDKIMEIELKKVEMMKKG